MPKDDRFVAYFIDHACLVVEGAQIFHALLRSDCGSISRHYESLSSIEKKADIITDNTIQAIHKTFITPFDRAQILELITGLDDILDLMKDTGRRVQRYGIAFTPEMVGMAGYAVEATTALRDGMPLLANVGRNFDALDSMQGAVRRAERAADGLLDRGLATLFAGESSPGQKLTAEKVYDLIEAVGDRCEDVADVIQNIVIEQV